MSGKGNVERFVQRFAGAAVLILTVGVMGCSGGAVPQDHFYRLPVDVPESLAAPQLPGILLVERFAADAVTSQRPVAFAEQPDVYDLKQYHYHIWADAPPKLLQEATVDYLRERGVAEQVMTAEARVLAGHLLTGKIKHLEHLRGKTPQVNVRVEFALTRLRDNQLLWSESFGEAQSVDDASVGGAIRVMGQGFQVILEQLVQQMESD